MNLKTFYDECRKRSVISNLSVYAVSSWVLVQVAATTFPYLGFPRSAVTLVIILVLIGLPLTIILSWYYNIVPDPEDTEAKTVPEATQNFQRNKMFLLVTGVLSIAVLAVIIQLVSNNLMGHSPTKSDQSEKFAVAAFANNTQDESLNAIGKMISDYVSHGMSQNKVGSVIDYSTIEEYERVSKASVGVQSPEKTLSGIFGPIRVIDGSYYKQGDDLIFQMHITGSDGSKYAHTFDEFKCDINNPLEGIDQIKQAVLGYLAVEDKEDEKQTPPLYDAYQHYLLARDNWNKDYDAAEEHLLKALEIDSTYAEAQNLLIALLINEDRYKEARAMINDMVDRFDAIDPKLRLSEFQKNDVEFHKAILDIDYRKLLKKMDQLYTSRPYDVFSNISYMVIANEFVNKPELVFPLYEDFNDELVDYEKCHFCANLIRNTAMAYNNLGKPLEAIKLLEPVLELTNRRVIRRELINAYAKAGQMVKLREFVDQAQKEKLDKSPKFLYILAAQACHLNGKEKERDYFIEKGLEAYPETDQYLKNRLKLIGEQYSEVLPFFEARAEAKPEDLTILRNLAISHFGMNQNDKGEEIVEQMLALKKDYDMGRNSYFIAQVYSVSPHKEKMYAFLEKALEEGRRYSSTSFHNDYIMRDFIKEDRFVELLRYWH